MKKLTLLTAALALVLFTGTAQAALIGLDIGRPDILSNTVGTYAYNATTNVFSSTAMPLTITYDGINRIRILGNNAFYGVNFLVDENGNFAGNGTGLIISGWVDRDGDFVIDPGEENGTLLTGNVTNFGWLDQSPNKYDTFDFTFVVTGGLLANDFGGIGATGGDFMTSETSTFTGSFRSDFAGIQVKHDTAALVPEPASMMLLGLGVLGLFGLKRRKA